MHAVCAHLWVGGVHGGLQGEAAEPDKLTRSPEMWVPLSFLLLSLTCRLAALLGSLQPREGKVSGVLCIPLA